jgi:phage terminase small subunit
VKQPGRKSADSLASVTQLAPFRLPQPPSDLDGPEAEVWGRVVASMPADWWDAGSLPLLAAYCRAVVQSEAVGELVRAVSQALVSDPDELGRYKELRKIQAALSAEMIGLGRQLRLTPQSRQRADAAAVANGKAKRARPWDRRVIEG